VTCRDKTLFFTHVLVAAVLGVFCGAYLSFSAFDPLFIHFLGGLYYQTGIDIAGFQSRVGCLFFLVRSWIFLVSWYSLQASQGSLIAFSSLSALYNVVEIRPLFLRERSSMYYRCVFYSDSSHSHNHMWG
jgi:hypothetical protein